MLGQALVDSNDRARVDEAITLLQAASIREPEVPDAYTQLAMAYGRKGDLAHADLASAQAAFMRGDIKTAREIASPRQDPFSGRLARLGQGRRHRQLQAAAERCANERRVNSRRTSIMRLDLRFLAAALIAAAGGVTARRTRADLLRPSSAARSRASSATIC